ncbi:MAG: EVE domain-containing protein [Pyrinomonadaceae bacterium]
MKYWLVKQEPTNYSWEDFIKDGKTDWTGVRNAQARNNLLEMEKGDQVLFYHSNIGKAVVGIAELTRKAFPDPTTIEERWVAVELKPVKALAKPVELGTIKKHKDLKEIALVRQSRLSVVPLTKKEFNIIIALAK